MVRILLNGGANIEALLMDYTPLLLAASMGRKRMVELLVELGADVNAEKDCENAYEIASSKGHDDIAEFLSLSLEIITSNQKEDDISTVTGPGDRNIR